jgi:hypothetical protein
MGSLAGPVGFDAADQLGGGPVECADAATEVDGDRVGDVDGDGLPGVGAAEGDLLPTGTRDVTGQASCSDTSR